MVDLHFSFQQFTPLPHPMNDEPPHEHPNEAEMAARHTGPSPVRDPRLRIPRDPAPLVTQPPSGPVPTPFGPLNAHDTTG